MSSQALPRTVSVRKYAAAGHSLSGTIPLARLPRVAAAILQAAGPFAVEIEFAENEFGKRTLRARVDGSVALACQRCLKPVTIAVQADSILTVVAHDAEAKASLRDVDPLIVEGDELEVYALVEDELLMALPIVALHEQEDCTVQIAGFNTAAQEPANRGNEAAADSAAVSAGERENPFAVLRELKPGKQD
ncbi:MAG: DUF177 domain-containing protein [Gammaproteobacteria bacterium]|nr:DUF177 domain-containing protein [Gammaproteobacteria bacterium]NND38747.1 hypothetical protein [Pseudomonadales bacterium]MBT8151268.1 DUF177 domain-containing protein [Gammaproteobacteria bacterium]NNL11133.1 hypothetical protein [Pseudomonadales bacterium]NNM12211.1 hypothetical protein [Pseudomonadales bacterium]